MTGKEQATVAPWTPHDTCRAVVGLLHREAAALERVADAIERGVPIDMPLGEGVRTISWRLRSTVTWLGVANEAGWERAVERLLDLGARIDGEIANQALGLYSRETSHGDPDWADERGRIMERLMARAPEAFLEVPERTHHCAAAFLCGSERLVPWLARFIDTIGAERLVERLQAGIGDDPLPVVAARAANSAALCVLAEHLGVSLLRQRDARGESALDCVLKSLDVEAFEALLGAGVSLDESPVGGLVERSAVLAFAQSALSRDERIRGVRAALAHGGRVDVRVAGSRHTVEEIAQLMMERHRSPVERSASPYALIVAHARAQRLRGRLVGEDHRAPEAPEDPPCGPAL